MRILTRESCSFTVFLRLLCACRFAHLPREKCCCYLCYRSTRVTCSFNKRSYRRQEIDGRATRRKGERYARIYQENRDQPLLISIAFFTRLDTTNQTMDTFESSSSSSANNHIHRNTWSNYPAECYSTSADYYRPYGTARKYPRRARHRSKPRLFFSSDITSVGRAEQIFGGQLVESNLVDVSLRRIPSSTATCPCQFHIQQQRQQSLVGRSLVRSNLLSTHTAERSLA